MKPFLLTIAVCFCLLSCQKAEVVSPGMFGKWELHRMYGGLYYRDTTFVAGNGTVYQFNNDSTYHFFQKNKPTRSGTYSYVKDGYDGGGPNKFDELIFDNAPNGDMIVMEGTKLTIGNTWTDNIAVEYIKIADQ